MRPSLRGVKSVCDPTPNGRPVRDWALPLLRLPAAAAAPTRKPPLSAPGESLRTTRDTRLHDLQAARQRLATPEGRPRAAGMAIPAATTRVASRLQSPDEWPQGGFGGQRCGGRSHASAPAGARGPRAAHPARRPSCSCEPAAARAAGPRRFQPWAWPAPWSAAASSGGRESCPHSTSSRAHRDRVAERDALHQPARSLKMRCPRPKCVAGLLKRQARCSGRFARSRAHTSRGPRPNPARPTVDALVRRR